jgi:CHAD domain-containing protein
MPPVGSKLAAGETAAAGKVARKRLSGDGDSGPSRAYRLKTGEAANDGIRRIALGRVDNAVEQLSERSGDDFAGAVHEARKDLKKARAVVRLIRDELGPERYREQNARFRDIGRLLSGPRDAEVKLETLAALEERFGDELDGADLARYREGLEAERDRAKESADEAAEGYLAEALGELEVARRDVEQWPLGSEDWSLVAGGLGRSYVRGRRALRATIDAPTDEHVHEWRKRVKDLWYHLRILREVRPEFTDPTADEAHELSDLLGEHHDLAVLRQDFEGRPAEDGGPERTLALTGAIALRQDGLLDPALSLGSRLYDEKRKAFVKRLGAYWDSWRGDGR